MADIPAPRTERDATKNEHLIPKCYLKAWKYNQERNSTVWVYEKNKIHRSLNPQKSDWTLESKPVNHVMSRLKYYDIKAGDPYMPANALHYIYDPIMKFNVSYDGKILDSAELLNQYFYLFNKWDIKDSSDVPLTDAEIDSLNTYFNGTRWMYLETEWGHAYENDWKSFIEKIEKNVRRDYAHRNVSTTSSLTQNELERLIKYYIVFNWRSRCGNELFNELYDALLSIGEWKKIKLSEANRMFGSDETFYDQIKHASLIKTYVEYLCSDSGWMKIMEADFAQKLKPVFLLTDDENPFITSDMPAFMIDNDYGSKDYLFVATPTLLIRYLNKSIDCATTNKLSADDVLYYNRLIAKHGDTLIIKDENYDVRGLFV